MRTSQDPSQLGLVCLTGTMLGGKTAGKKKHLNRTVLTMHDRPWFILLAAKGTAKSLSG